MRDKQRKWWIASAVIACAMLSGCHVSTESGISVAEEQPEEIDKTENVEGNHDVDITYVSSDESVATVDKNRICA